MEEWSGIIWSDAELIKECITYNEELDKYVSPVCPPRLRRPMLTLLTLLNGPSTDKSVICYHEASIFCSSSRHPHLHILIGKRPRTTQARKTHWARTSHRVRELFKRVKEETFYKEYYNSAPPQINGHKIYNIHGEIVNIEAKSFHLDPWIGSNDPELRAYRESITRQKRYTVDSDYEEQMERDNGIDNNGFKINPPMLSEGELQKHLSTFWNRD